MKLYNEPFSKIKHEEKTIEVRLNDLKRQKISIGDEIEFSLIDNNEKILVKVIGLSKFISFSHLFSSFNCKMFGHPEEISIDNQISRVREIYSQEKEREFGVLGIHIKLI